MNKDISSFSIDSLGTFSILVSLLSIDYPRIFVAQKDDLKSYLLLFEEIEVKDSNASWAVTRISFRELDYLNRGLRTIQDCFRGPRNEKRLGFRVTAINGKQEAKSEPVEDVFSLIEDGAFYPDQFVRDQHGAGLLSLVYGTSFFSTVIDDSSFSNPLLLNTRLEEAFRSGKKMLRSLPFSLESRLSRSYLADGHSIVLNIEIAEKKCNSNPQQISLLGQKEKSESAEAAEALKTVMSSESTNVDIINALKSDKNALTECQSFLKEMRRNNPKGKTVFEIVDSSDNISSSITIDETNETGLQTKLSESIKELGIAKRNENDLTRYGTFLMFDTTGKRKFKFKSVEPSGDSVVYIGFAEEGFNPDKLPLNLTISNYKATIKEVIFVGAFGSSKPVYTLIRLDKTDNYQQEKLFSI